MAKFWEKNKSEKITDEAPEVKTESSPFQGGPIDLGVAVAEPLSQEKESTPITLLAETDAYIHERMKAQPKSLDKIKVEVEKDWESRGHALQLPKELEKYGKDYAFRWINKKKRAIDHAVDVIGWTFVNKVLFKDAPKYLFTANGSIERGDAILAFMPLKRAIQIRLRPAEISRERVRNTPVQDLRRWEDRGENYYKPDLGAAENDNERPVGISVSPDTDTKETES